MQHLTEALGKGVLGRKFKGIMEADDVNVERVVASVAMAIADVFFRKNAISVGSKFTKMLRIFDKIDEMNSRRVI